MTVNENPCLLSVATLQLSSMIAVVNGPPASLTFPPETNCGTTIYTIAESYSWISLIVDGDTSVTITAAPTLDSQIGVH